MYIYIQDGDHLGFPIRMILATFDLQVTSILRAFWFNIKKSKIDFQHGIYKSPWYFLSSFESIDISVQKKFENSSIKFRVN